MPRPKSNAYSDENLRSQEQYLQMDTSQAIELAMKELENNVDSIRDCAGILRDLACLRPEIMPSLHEAILSAAMELAYFPEMEILFRNASKETIDTLIKYAATIKGLHCFAAVAWAGSEYADNTLHELQKDPPTWYLEAMQEYETYSLEYFNYRVRYAGWELSNDGGRHDLLFEKQYLLEWQKRDVSIHPEELGNCQWCQQPLTVLFDFDLSDERLEFLGLQGERLMLPLCLSCFFDDPSNPIFFEVDTQGKAVWSEHNQVLENPYGEKFDSSYWLQHRPVVIGDERVIFEGLRNACDYSRFVVGGHPNWVHYPSYPICPQCNKRMKFLAQCQEEHLYYASDAEDLAGELVGDDGIIYGFLCPDCMLATYDFQCG